MCLRATSLRLLKLVCFDVTQKLHEEKLTPAKDYLNSDREGRIDKIDYREFTQRRE